MRIRSDRRHRFDAPPDQLWAAMERVDRYRDWWPWLRRFEADALEPGDVWTASVQPPLPYRVSFELRITQVEAPRLVAAELCGDIEGSARLVVSATDEGSELHFTSELAPTNRVLRAVAGIAGPVAKFGHEWVLETGLRQFRDRAL